MATGEHRAFEICAGAGHRRELRQLRSTAAMATGDSHAPEGRQPADARNICAEGNYFALVAGGARRATLHYRLLRLACRQARDATVGAPPARGQPPGLGFAR